MADIAGTIRHLFIPETAEERDNIREARPFFLVVVLLLVGLYGYAVFTNPALRATGWLLVFTALMLLHAVLHWNTPIINHRPRAALPYMMVQGVLAFFITSIIGDPVMALTLFAVLIGESVGVIHDGRKVAVAVIFQAALATVSLVRLSGWADFPAQWLLILAISGFVVLYVVLFGRQAEARKRSQALLQELEIAHEQLGEYAARVEDLTRTAERERMARELHDTLAQGLAGLILQLEAADAHLVEDRPGRAQEIIRQAMARARTTLADSRRVIDDLRADQSESVGLAEGVRKEASRFSDATGIPCLVELDSLDDVPGDIGEHTRRVVAEALANIAHHAQAKQTTVTIRGEDDRLLIAVGDDGIGFEPAIQEIESGHYGLIGMRERARLVGGSLNIVSVPGQGTTLSVELPYHSGDGEPAS